MIYLLDDKENRQKIDYGWTSEKFAKYSEYIKPIHKVPEAKSLNMEIFREDNIVIFHESFFNNSSYDSSSIISNLEYYSKNKKDSFRIVFFSGSRDTRSLDENRAYLPVYILYQHLEVFIKKVSEGDINLRYLLFGKNYKLESWLLDFYKDISNHINSQYIDSSNLRILYFEDDIYKYSPFSTNDVKIEEISGIYIGDDIKLNEKLTRLLSTDTEYDIIFIPLCFGYTLSDFNGLKLATYIRCIGELNSLKNIFIYGPSVYKDLCTNEYFDILKTEKVHLINCSEDAFRDAISKDLSPISKDRLPKEIAKIKLTPPQSYVDSHSIANEWAIYRWSKSISLGLEDDNDICSILKRVENNLYFKYLKTIYPEKEIIRFDKKQLVIKKSKKAKILYIDDEVKKGWGEIFSIILKDLNNFDVDYVGDDFKGKDQEEIIRISKNTIKEKDIDIVILDFRLHENDFSSNDISKITGYQLLKEIKEVNKGIQIIIFSATNKVWNLQALQEAGADGFIIKEAPENSIDNKFTKECIDNFIKTIDKACRLNFLKKVYTDLKVIEEQIRSNNKTKDKIEEAKSYIDIAFTLLSNTYKDEEYFKFAYMQLFLTIELVVNSYYSNGYISGEDICVYNKKELALSFEDGKYKLGKSTSNKMDVDNNTNFKVSACLIFKFGNENSSVKDWSDIYKKRNKGVAHYNQDDNSTNIDNKDIDIIINFLIYFTDEGNFKYIYNDKGLEQNLQENIESLQKMFNGSKKKYN